MRALANDHYGFMIDALDKAKRDAKPTATWDAKGIERVTFMGPRQMAQQNATAIAQAVRDGNVAFVREQVHRFRDLNEAISESLTDSELMAEVTSVLRQIDGHLPVRIDDLSDLPPGIRDFANDHPGDQLCSGPMTTTCPSRCATRRTGS